MRRIAGLRPANDKTVAKDGLIIGEAARSILRAARRADTGDEEPAIHEILMG